MLVPSQTRLEPSRASCGRRTTKFGRWCRHTRHAFNATSTSNLQRAANATEPIVPRSNDGQGFWNVLASSQAFGQQLLSHFSRWPGPNLLAEKVLQEASNKEREKQRTSVPPDIRPYLHPTAVWEMKHIRKLSHLCSITYKPHKVTVTHMKRCHNLDLVTSSWTPTTLPFDSTRTVEEVSAEGDGMVVSFNEVRRIYNAGRGQEEPLESLDPAPEPVLPTLPMVPVQVQVQGQVQAAAAPQEPKRKASPADAVTTKLAEAAMAASAAASAAASPLATVAGSLYAGIASSLPIPSLVGGSSSNGNSNGSSSGSSNGDSSKPLSLMAQALVTSSAATSLMTELTAGSSGGGGQAAATTTVQQAVAATAGPAKILLGPAGTAVVSPLGSSVSPACPSEWFICDDPARHLRIFVVQGSDTIDHWKLNLTFDPVTFEDPALGVTVHRGVYEAAQVLYDKFLPYVYEHLDSSPFARVTFTGHSIGGALVTLLMLMYKKRGVLTSRSIATVYTFGAPSVFCEGPPLSEQPGPADSTKVDGSAASWDSVDLQDFDAFQHPAARPCSKGCCCGSSSGPGRLLSALGLRDQVVRNVIMHRDIVPRVFACDYSLVADIFRSWGAAFRDHCCLSGDGRKHLYYFVGRMIVLQPDRSQLFVNNEPDHPLLPPGPGLHYLAEPTDMLVPQPSRASIDDVVPTSSIDLPQVLLSSDVDRRSDDEPANGPAGRLQKKASRVPATAREAVLELMDRPHPLETLADPAAYLEKGSISRYHNPDNYTMAFGRIIHLQRQQERGPSAAARQLPAPGQALGTSGSLSSVDGVDGNTESQSVWESSDYQLDPFDLCTESGLHC